MSWLKIPQDKQKANKDKQKLIVVYFKEVKCTMCKHFKFSTVSKVYFISAKQVTVLHFCMEEHYSQTIFII